MIKRDEIIEIGAFNKPHGISGEMSATFLCDVDEISQYSCIIININGIFVPFYISSIREKNTQTVLIKLDGLDDEEAVKSFIKHDIYVLKKEYSSVFQDDESDDDMSADCFIGFRIIDSNHGYIGEIVDVDDSTENYLFVVNNEENEFFIPITNDFIKKIDEKENTIFMTLPDGILDL